MLATNYNYCKKQMLNVLYICAAKTMLQCKQCSYGLSASRKYVSYHYYAITLEKEIFSTLLL